MSAPNPDVRCTKACWVVYPPGTRAICPCRRHGLLRLTEGLLCWVALPVIAWSAVVFGGGAAYNLIAGVVWR